MKVVRDTKPIHDNKKNNEGQQKVEQFTDHFGKGKLNSRNIERFDQACRANDAGYRLVGNIGKEKPENKTRCGVKDIIIYRWKLRAENDYENKQENQRFKEAPEKSN